ncbi:MAG: hypothetical protein WCP89_00180 [archaeon]
MESNNLGYLARTSVYLIGIIGALSSTGCMIREESYNIKKETTPTTQPTSRTQKDITDNIDFLKGFGL